MSELNTTIIELQQMSEKLQVDCKDKGEKVNKLETENQDLKKELETLQEKAQQKESQRENVERVKVQSLNEEISYLKKHYMVEMDALRHELHSMREYQEKTAYKQDQDRSLSKSPRNF